MSWDASIHCNCCDHAVCEVNYTHNTNSMIAEAIRAIGLTAPVTGEGPLAKAIGPAWWDLLDGMYGAEGREFLLAVLEELESDPVKYEAMNPSNRWGSRVSLIQVLQEMCEAVPTYPTTWRVSG